jgi:hypothetical protein
MDAKGERTVPTDKQKISWREIAGMKEIGVPK